MCGWEQKTVTRQLGRERENDGHDLYNSNLHYCRRCLQPHGGVYGSLGRSGSYFEYMGEISRARDEHVEHTGHEENG